MLVTNLPKYRLFGLVICLVLVTVQGCHYMGGLREAELEARESNVEIKFHGKVFDQNGQAVQGAKVTFEVFSKSEHLISQLLLKGIKNAKISGNTTREVYTGEYGLFSVTDLRGESAKVRDIEKEGYLFKRGKNYYYTRSKAETYKQATPSEPAEFVLWKQGETLALLNREVNMRFKPDEHKKPRLIRLIDFPDNPGYAEQGDFRITAYNQGRGLDENNHVLRRKYDWWVNIEAVNGGLLETNDVWLYEAPESGYQKTLTIEEHHDAPEWRVSDDIKIYFKTHGNYGSAELKIIANSGGNIGVYIDNVLINPGGSRNLEYDKAKKIKIKYQ